jgi:hypothetical protein
MNDLCSKSSLIASWRARQNERHCSRIDLCQILSGCRAIIKMFQPGVLNEAIEDRAMLITGAIVRAST